MCQKLKTYRTQLHVFAIIRAPCVWMDQGNLRARTHVCPCGCVCAPGRANMPPLCVCLCLCLRVYSHAGSRPPCGRREWGAGSPARGSRRCAGRPSAATSTPCRRTASPPAAASGSSSVPTLTVRLSVTPPTLLLPSYTLSASLRTLKLHKTVFCVCVCVCVVTHFTNMEIRYPIFRMHTSWAFQVFSWIACSGN